MMKLQNLMLIAAVLVIPANVWAYGDNSASGSGSGICKKVNFSEFLPVNNSEVAPRSEFSFYASESTFPKSIKVTIKGQSVPVTVIQKQSGYKVSGKLPDSVKGTFAKINIDAKGIAQCEVSEGWLVKVTE
jgi:uracil DNA glycosylase